MTAAAGRRVVLLISRPGPGDRVSGDDERLASTLGELEEGGYDLVALVDPEAYLDALRMVVDGMADLVVVTRPEHFPVVQLAADLNGHGSRRARPVLRPAGNQGQEPATGRRRPQLVGVERPTVLLRERRTQVIPRTA